MEDCDLDGYDDHTGKPVPWRGFDGTKGDEVPSDWMEYLIVTYLKTINQTAVIQIHQAV